MAHDPVRNRTVLFGGACQGESLVHDQTWEWDGVGWTQKFPANRPSARTGHAMFFDPVRQRVVLHGGHGAGFYDDLWEWDGDTWTLVATGGPEPRTEHAMAWDSLRNRAILFGGYNDDVANSDTWAWDGTSWTKLSSAGPIPRVLHVMEYDPVRDRVLLFGGKTIGENSPEPSPGYLQDTWEWDGTQWVEIQGTGPIRRVEHKAFYDLDLEKVVVHGGKHRPYNEPNGYPIVLSDTWTWDGTAWVELDVEGPTPRTSIGLAYNSVDRRAVMFGGYHQPDEFEFTTFGDTWEFGIPGDPKWTNAEVAGPSARSSHAMAYDRSRDRVVLFGGYSPDPGLVNDTWEWDGESWVEIQPAHRPSARNGHAMAYDAARERVVLFGGYGDTFLGDTWEWDGSDWTQVATSGPEPRSEHALAYDAQRERVVLFGGYNDTTATSDTWEWDGVAWTRVATEGPMRRVNHSMAYDAGRQRIVLFGGMYVHYEGEPEPAPGVLDDTWEWNGTSWTPITAAGPVARIGHRLFYDSARQRVVLFGGESADEVALADTWLWDGAIWSQAEGAGGTARLFSDVAYDTTGRGAILFGGRAGLTWFGDTWRYR